MVLTLASLLYPWQGWCLHVLSCSLSQPCNLSVGSVIALWKQNADWPGLFQCLQTGGAAPWGGGGMSSSYLPCTHRGDGLAHTWSESRWVAEQAACTASTGAPHPSQRKVMGTFNQGCGNYQVPLTRSPAQTTDPHHVDLKCEIVSYWQYIVTDIHNSESFRYRNSSRVWKPG